MKIFNPDGSQAIVIEVDDNSYHSRTIMGDDIVVLYYSLPEHYEPPVGSYIVLDGIRYTLMQPQNINMVHSRNYQYTLTLHAPQGKTFNWLVSNPIDHRLSFDLTATPREHLQLVIDNLNQREEGWVIGDCITDTEKLISYNYHYAWDAIRDIATAFDTEYEITGKTIHLHKVEYNKDNPLRMDYGKGNGFKSGIGRANDGNNPPPDILYVQGGSQNINYYRYGTTPQGIPIRGTAFIPSDMQHSYNLLLPRSKSYAYDGAHFEDEAGFSPATARHYETDKFGRYVKRTDNTRNTDNEEAYDCSNHYPKRICEVTAVSYETQPDGIRQYDIADNTIPESLDFSQYVIEGETMRVVFQTGNLAGREFDIAKNGYIHHSDLPIGSRVFLLVSKDEDGTMMPSANGFEPQVGDKFIVYGIMLPSAYIADDNTRTGAEWDMLRASIRYLHSIEDYLYTFKGDIDDIWAHRNWRTLQPLIRLGQYVNFTNESIAQGGLLMRMSAIKQYINRPYRIELTITNAPIKTDFSDERRRIASFEQSSTRRTTRRTLSTSAHIRTLSDIINRTALDPSQLLDVRRMAVFYDSPILGNVIEPPFSFGNNSVSLAECYAQAKGQLQIVTAGTSPNSMMHIQAKSYQYTENDKEYFVYLLHGVTIGQAEIVLSSTPIEYAQGATIRNVYIGKLSAAAQDFSRTFSKAYYWTDTQSTINVSDILVNLNGTTSHLNETMSAQDSDLDTAFAKANEIIERANDLTELLTIRLTQAFNNFNNQQVKIGGNVIAFNTCIAPTIGGRAVDGQCKPFPPINDITR